MDSFSESLQYITSNVESQFEVRLQEFDNTYNENVSWLESVSKDCKSAFESTIERIFLAEKKTKAKQTRELFTPLKEFNYSAPDRAALSRQLATPASAYRPRTRAATKQQQDTIVVDKENQMPVENKIVEEKVVEVKKPVETKKVVVKGKSKVQAAVEKMEEKIIEERFGKKKVEEKPVEQPKKEEVVVVEETEEDKKEDDEVSEKEDDKPQGRAGRLKATRTTAAAKKAAAAAKRAATIAEKKARAAREAEEREKAEKEEQERQAKLEEEKAEQARLAAAEAKEKKRLEREEKQRQAKLEKEKAEQEEKERLEREEKEREAKAKKAAEEAENESEEEAPAPKKKGRTKKTYVKKTATRGRKRARAAESEDESEAQSASEEVPKPKTKKAKLSNEKSDAEHVIEDVKMDEAKEEKPVEKVEVAKDEEDEFIVDVVSTATPAKKFALPTPAIDDAVMADLHMEFEENIEIITTKTPSKPKVAPRISTDSQDEVDVVITKPKTADFIVHEETETSSSVVASVVEPLNTEVTRASELDSENAMQVDSDAESQSETSQGPSTLTESGDDIAKAEKKQKKVGFAASQSKSTLATSNSSKALDVNDKLKRAADNRQMLEQKKREELEKKRAQAVSKVEALKKAREDPVKKTETASSIAAKKMEVEETKEEETKKAEVAQEAAKEEDAQSRRKRFLVQSLEEKKHNSASRETNVETAPKPQGPAPAPQGPKLSLLAFLKKPATLTSEAASTTQTTSATTPDLEDSESSGSEKEATSSVDLKSAANVIPKPAGVPKPQSSFSDLRKFIRDGSDEHVAPAPKPAVVAPTPVVTAPTPVVESKPLPSASNFGFKQISRENSANNISAPSSIKSTTSTTSTNGPASLAPPSIGSVQSQMRDAHMMPPPQSPSSIRATSIKSFIPIKLAQSPKASPHSPQQVLSPKLSASMLYSPSPPRSPLRPRGFLDSPECQCPILDYCSDDDSDSEVDLPVPAWTQKENLYKALEMQTTIDPDEIFGKELGKNIDLNAIFGPNPRRPAYKK